MEREYEAHLYDTHCHLDASEFDLDRDRVIERARHAGVRAILIPAVEVDNFERVRDLAHGLPEGFYAIGIHPMYVDRARDDDLERVRAFVADHLDDPKLVAIGEIGLDFFVQAIASGAARNRQIFFYRQQLEFARQVSLPVLLHVRKSQDELLKWLRREGSPGGIAHAFNGSHQQAQQFIEQGFALGIGGAMTFTRALQIRRLAREFDLSHLVLETDAPDMSPAWLARSQRNEPAEVAEIARALAALRDCDVETVLEKTSATARRVVRRLSLMGSAL
ncbi:TatD family hydrolase [Orrella marina]|uniref:DNAase n=1 Tax=Orrella marina TaxID=2163011 RepID=A0A2R4XHR3_9BURK|nr:TatD family hydrolase [Orrella marina]AWB33311.1 DNAase [Orrella marina]